MNSNEHATNRSRGLLKGDTCHCVQGDKRLGQEEVEDVVQLFPEEEPLGVDVFSHLRNNQRKAKLVLTIKQTKRD